MNGRFFKEMETMITDKWIDNFKQKTTLQQLATLMIEKVLNYKENVEKLWDVLEDKDIFLEYIKYICLLFRSLRLCLQA